MSIHQGDQYSISFKIKNAGAVVTPSNVDDVRIQVGSVLKTYSDSQITYDSSAQTWQFPLTEAITREMDIRGNGVQIGVKTGNSIIYSEVKPVDVSRSIIKGGWNTNE